MESIIYDATGAPLKTGGVVEVTDEDASYQGSFATIVGAWFWENPPLGKDRWLAVLFLNLEYPLLGYSSGKKSSLNPQDWDRKYRRMCVDENFGFLFDNPGSWDYFHRVLTFETTFLTCRDSMPRGNRVLRMFPNCHTATQLSEDFIIDPNHHRCVAHGCDAPAEKIAVRNFAGIAQEVLTCKSCFKRIHGHTFQ